MAHRIEKVYFWMMIIFAVQNCYILNYWNLRLNVRLESEFFQRANQQEQTFEEKWKKCRPKRFCDIWTRILFLLMDLKIIK